MLFDQLYDFLEHSDSLPGKTLFMADFNFHFENNNSRKLHDILDIFNLSKLPHLLTTKAICLTFYSLSRVTTSSSLPTYVMGLHMTQSHLVQT